MLAINIIVLVASVPSTPFLRFHESHQAPHRPQRASQTKHLLCNWQRLGETIPCLRTEGGEALKAQARMMIKARPWLAFAMDTPVLPNEGAPQHMVK